MTQQQNFKSPFKQDLSPIHAWSFAIGTTIGWGSLVVTSNTYLAQAGPAGSVLGMLLGMIVMLIVSHNYGYMMQCYPDAGGAYTFAKETFGHDHGFLTAWFLSLTYLSILWANVTSLPLFSHYFFGNVFRFGKLYTIFDYDVYLGETILPVLALLLFGYLCCFQRRLSIHLMTAMSVIFSLGIISVFASAFFALDRPLEPAFIPDASSLSQIIRIAVISPWAYIGFENISHFSEEFSFKRTKAFRLLVLTVVISTLLYIFIILLSVTAFPQEYETWMDYISDLGQLEGIKALPAFYAAEHYLGAAGIWILMLSLLCLILTSLIGNISVLGRLFYALGKDHILPDKFGQLNGKGAPQNGIFLVCGLSFLIPLLGRTAIGWIVDVTTIGATIIYAIVSASARKMAVSCGDKKDERYGLAGLVLMVAFLAYLLLPSLLSESSMAKETYFLFIVWSILGFVFFRHILHHDPSRRFGNTIIVWVALLALVLFIALIWMRQSMISSNHVMMDNIREHYLTTGVTSQVRLEDEQFIQDQLQELEKSNAQTILMTTAMFVFALVIMMTNYSFMNKQNKESQMIANTDPLTHVKSKHAYLDFEKNMDASIRSGNAPPFAVVVCDVNGLKYVNDTYGHKAGDEYIRSASAMICELFQHSPVFRVGGDEFVALLKGRDYEVRDALMAELHRRSEENITTGQVVVAGGISDFISGQDTAMHSVFERADNLMYQKKQELKQMGAKTR